MSNFYQDVGEFLNLLTVLNAYEESIRPEACELKKEIAFFDIETDHSEFYWSFIERLECFKIKKFEHFMNVFSSKTNTTEDKNSKSLADEKAKECNCTLNDLILIYEELNHVLSFSIVCVKFYYKYMVGFYKYQSYYDLNLLIKTMNLIYKHEMSILQCNRELNRITKNILGLEKQIFSLTVDTMRLYVCNSVSEIAFSIFEDKREKCLSALKIAKKGRSCLSLNKNEKIDRLYKKLSNVILDANELKIGISNKLDKLEKCCWKNVDKLRVIYSNFNSVTAIADDIDHSNVLIESLELRQRRLAAHSNFFLNIKSETSRHVVDGEVFAYESGNEKIDEFFRKTKDDFYMLEDFYSFAAHFFIFFNKLVIFTKRSNMPRVFSVKFVSAKLKIPDFADDKLLLLSESKRILLNYSHEELLRDIYLYDIKVTETSAQIQERLEALDACILNAENDVRGAKKKLRSEREWFLVYQSINTLRLEILKFKVDCDKFYYLLLLMLKSIETCTVGNKFVKNELEVFNGIFCRIRNFESDESKKMDELPKAHEREITKLSKLFLDYDKVKENFECKRDAFLKDFPNMF